MIGVLLDHWHRVTGINHLWENDQLGVDVFCPARKIDNLGQIRFRIAERARDLSNSDLHLSVERNSGPLRSDWPAVSEKLSLCNQVSDFRWNHLLPSAVAGL